MPHLLQEGQKFVFYQASICRFFSFDLFVASATLCIFRQVIALNLSQSRIGDERPDDTKNGLHVSAMDERHKKKYIMRQFLLPSEVC